MQAQLLVLAKEPRPGFAKTRLTPPLTPGQGADVARAALLDTLAAASAVDVARTTVVLDGSPDGWLPAGLHVLPQREGDLGARLAAAFADAHAALTLPMLLIGMDTPQVTPALLTAALRQLLADPGGAVLGAAEDGGWWALGLHTPLPGAFDGVPMSTDRAGQAQRSRLHELGVTTTALPVLRDIDVAADVAHVAALLPRQAHLAAVTAELPAATG